MKKLVFDLDELLPMFSVDSSATEIQRIAETIEKYRAEGFSVVFTYSQTTLPSDGSAETPATHIQELNDHLSACSICCDALLLGRPSLTESTLVLDDKAVTFDEFTTLSHEEIMQLLKEEAREAER